MSLGLAPSLMLDLAAAHIADHQRAARERADAAEVRRQGLGRLLRARAR